MYIITTKLDSGGRWYWTGTRRGWTLLRERAHAYKTGRAAAKALMDGSARHWEHTREVEAWASAEWVPASLNL